MPRTTTQAAALTHALRTFTDYPLRNPYGGKSYSCRTEAKRVRCTDSKGIRHEYNEYGNAYLMTTRKIPTTEAIRLAEHIASAGFSVVVFPIPSGPEEAYVLADTNYRNQHKVEVHDVVDGTYDGGRNYEVSHDPDLHAACWARANRIKN